MRTIRTSGFHSALQLRPAEGKGSIENTYPNANISSEVLKPVPVEITVNCFLDWLIYVDLGRSGLVPRHTQVSAPLYHVRLGLRMLEMQPPWISHNAGKSRKVE
ncbi:hypothetical protein OPQ81_003323 [Rhizoctonia solani]|nr:hypothetical protein OPQ81_003323 [Rhizoctonia solani]